MSTPVVPVAQPYPMAYVSLGLARLDLLNATLRVMLTGAAYVPADTDEFVAVPAQFETYGPGYVTGGPELVNRDWALDTTTGRAVLSADPVTFTDAGFLARFAVVYADTGDPTTSPLISRLDFGVAINPAGDDLQLAFAQGVIRVGPVT